MDLLCSRPRKPVSLFFPSKRGKYSPPEPAARGAPSIHLAQGGLLCNQNGERGDTQPGEMGKTMGSSPTEGWLVTGLAA